MNFTLQSAAAQAAKDVAAARKAGWYQVNWYNTESNGKRAAAASGPRKNVAQMQRKTLRNTIADALTNEWQTGADILAKLPPKTRIARKTIVDHCKALAEDGTAECKTPGPGKPHEYRKAQSTTLDAATTTK